MHNLTCQDKSLVLANIEEGFEKVGLLQISKQVNSINNGAATFGHIPFIKYAHLCVLMRE